MNDPFGSMQNMMGQFKKFMQNPAQFVMNNRLNIPQSVGTDPDSMLQYLVNSGQVSQEQYNWANQMAKKIQPMLGQSRMS